MVPSSWALVLLAAAGAEPLDTPPADTPVVAEPSAAAPAAPDPELARLNGGLDALLAGDSPVEVTVTELLGGAVPSAKTIGERIAALGNALEQLPATDETDTELRRSILTRQRQYLRRLARAYERMPRPAISAFELLTQPRTPIRAQAATIGELEAAVGALTERLRTLDDLLASGRLVGFHSDREPARRHLEAVASSLSSQEQRLSTLRASLESLAGEQEEAGRQLHEALLHTLATDAGSAMRDELYREHTREQRRLRQTVTAVANARQVAKQINQTNSLLAQPTAIGDVFGAEAAIADVQLHTQGIATLLDGLRNANDVWSLAFERELVTLLEPLASPEARAQAQKITTEIVEEIRIEAVDGWTHIVAWTRGYPGELRQFFSDWRAHVGQILAVLALLIFAIAFGTRRITPMRWLVHRLARWPWLRGHVGLVVRSGNLLQTVFPSVSVYVLLYLAIDVIGFERPGAQLIWVFVHWIGLFWIGRQIVQGITRPVARGRPALISATPDTAELVRVTYSRLGLIFAGAFIIDDIAAGWFGAGHLRALIDVVVIVWTGAWALWAAFAWRERLARAWSELAPKGEAEQRFAAWMQQNRTGALFSVVALLRIVVQRSLSATWWLLERTGVSAYLRAKSLRRLSREETTDSHAAPGKLPDEYLREFPLSPLADDGVEWALARPDTSDAIRSHLDAWRESRTDGSVVVIGEKGMGKTTLLAQMAASLDDAVTLHTWGDKATSAQQVVRELGPLFDCEDASDIHELIDVARNGPERILFLDEVHNVFLRTINGYRGLDALVELVNGTHEKVFWVLAFNTFAWEFLNQSRGRTHHFRRLVWLERWSNDELKHLIDERNKRSGFTVEFDPVILDADADTRDFQLVESADGFFRLLWESSGGNPRVGIYLWLQSLQMQFGSIRAKLFRQPSLEKISGLNDDMVFVLASIFQHENLSVDDLGTVLRLKSGQARFAMQFLREAGIVEQKGSASDSFTLSPRYYRQALRYLRGRHLLFEAS